MVLAYSGFVLLDEEDGFCWFMVYRDADCDDMLLTYAKKQSREVSGKKGVCVHSLVLIYAISHLQLDDTERI